MLKRILRKLFRRKRDVVIVDLAQIPDGWSIEKFINLYRSDGLIILDSKKSKVGPRATKI